MSMNWDLMLRIAIPFLTFILGRAWDRFFERKPKVIFYLGHASAFNLDDPPSAVHTHSLIIRNVGKKTAENVRVSHQIPPKINVFPAVEYRIEELPEGGREIVFPKLVPSDQVAISYLYFPPITWDQFDTRVKHDEGFGKVLNVLPTPQYPRWIVRIMQAFMWFGIMVALYLSIKGLIAFAMLFAD